MQRNLIVVSGMLVLTELVQSRTRLTSFIWALEPHTWVDVHIYQVNFIDNRDKRM